MFRMFLAGLSGLLLAGCTATRPVGLSDLGTHAPQADPAVAVTTVAYGSVIGSYTHRTPTDPAGWRGTGVEMAPVAGAAPPSEDAAPAGAVPADEGESTK